MPLPSSFKPWNSLILTGTPNPTTSPLNKLIAATGADIRFGGNRAFYSLAGDFICLPPKSSFIGGAYYATALHELAHWSEVRVGWERKKDSYAMGELIAEMASCFLATELGVPNSEATRKPRRLCQELAPSDERRRQLHLQGQPPSVAKSATSCSHS